MFESIAYAAEGAAQQQPSQMPFFLMMFGMVAIFYFFMIVPQQKKQKTHDAMVSGLKKGDKVVTIGGIMGVVTSIQNDYVVLRIGDSDQNKIEVLKSAVSGVLN